MDRLSAQDAIFLHLEGPNTPYHVASLMIFEGSPVDEDRLLGFIETRLHLVPRLRQKLAFVPFGQGRPVWIDDEHFDLRYHVRHLAVPPRGSQEQLLQICSELMEQHLDRSRPLWELAVLGGLEGNRWAIFGKTHHAMVDGVSGLDVTSVLLDTSPQPVWHTPGDWAPGRAPTPRALLTSALAERVPSPAAALRAAAQIVRHPRHAAELAVDDLQGLGAVAWSGIHPAPDCPLNVRIGPNRKLGVVRSTLADFKAVKQTLGGTVNDVVLAAVCGALRDWLVHRGERVDDVELKAMVPVSLRSEDGSVSIGNRVSTVLAPLPVGEPDPVKRFDRIRDATARAKGAHQAAGADLLMQVSGLVPFALVGQIARVQNAQRFFNLSITNLRGPAEALYGAGHRLLDLFPFTPLAGNMALIVAVVSYAGRMEFGITADAEALGDLDVIVCALERSIRELKEIAALTEREAFVERLRSTPA